jgi:hypothetical protein
MITKADVRLDTRTGLPELPEGYWWEVAKSKSDSWREEIFFTVGIRTRGVVREHTVASTTFWGAFFNRRVTVPAKEVDMWVVSLSVTDENCVEVDVKFLTPENILATAYRVVKRFHDDRETARLKLQSESLLGAYPPKTLI